MAEFDGGRSIGGAQMGSGRNRPLIHGALMTLEDMWLAPAPALAGHFRVTAVDRPGHGASRRSPLIDASPWRQAEAIHDFALAAGLHRRVVVGHFSGGTVALAYAMLFPAEPAGVVALAPICFPELRLELMPFGPRGVPLLGEALAPGLGASADPAVLPAPW